MPSNRRPLVRERRRDVPAAVALVVAGEPVPFSPENRRALVDAVYFGGKRLPLEIELRALGVLSKWRAEGL